MPARAAAASSIGNVSIIGSTPWSAVNARASSESTAEPEAQSRTIRSPEMRSTALQLIESAGAATMTSSPLSESPGTSAEIESAREANLAALTDVRFGP